MTFLWSAANRNDIDKVRRLLNRGVDQQSRNKALEIASTYGHTEIARMLLDVGEKINDQQLSEALYIASLNGHTEIVRLLLEAGADVHADRGLVYEAVQKGNAEIARLLLEAGADVHADRGLVYEAVQKGNAEIARLLLEAGAKLDNRDSSFIKTVQKGNVEMAELLLDAGADVHFMNDGALSLATRDGNTRMIRLLLDRWGNDPIPSSILIYPIVSNQFENVKILLQHDLANINPSELLQRVSNNPRMAIVLLQEPNIFLYALHHSILDPLVNEILEQLNLPYLRDVLLNDWIDPRSLQYRALKKALENMRL